VKKSGRLLCQRVALRSALMAQDQARGPVAVMGAVRQGRRRGLSADVPRHAAADGGAEAAARWTRGQAIAAETRHPSGSRRMAQPLQDDGVAVGRDNARRVMRHATRMVPRRTPRHPVTPERRQGSTVAPHLLARPCAVATPPQVWVGDLPSGWTAEGW
jgi:hypothetical protein